MSAEILIFPGASVSVKARKAYLRAFKALLTDCKCKNCKKYRKLLKIDEKAAKRFLLNV